MVNYGSIPYIVETLTSGQDTTQMAPYRTVVTVFRIGKLEFYSYVEAWKCLSADFNKEVFSGLWAWVRYEWFER